MSGMLRVVSELTGVTASGVHVRQADLGDAPLLARLNADVQDLHAHGEPRVFKPADAAAAEEMFRDALVADATVVFLAEVAGEAVGYLMAAEVEGAESASVLARRSLFIRHLSVTAEARQRGVGQALMAAAEQEARRRGVDTMTLDHWAFNETAARFFARQGFEVFNVRRRRMLD